MREETSLSHVEDVMDEFYEGNEDLEQVRESLDSSFNAHDGGSHHYDIEELEKELLTLGKSNDGSNGPSNEGHPDHVAIKDCSNEKDDTRPETKSTKSPVLVQHSVAKLK